MDCVFTENAELMHWLVVRCKTPSLLMGKWDEFPLEKGLFLGASAGQIAIGLIGLIGVIGILLNKRHTVSEIVFPFLVCFWEILLGGFNIALVLSWFSAASMALVYLHAQVELYLFVFRILYIRRPEEGVPLWKSPWIQVSFAFTVLTMSLFLLTSNPNLQGVLAGTAFLTDFILILTIPSFLLRMTKTEPSALPLEIVLSFLFVLHVPYYYPPLVLPRIPNPPQSSFFFAKWVVGFAFTNTCIFAVYVVGMLYACWKGSKS